MNKIITYITIVVLTLCVQKMEAQYDYQSQMKTLKEGKASIEAGEKAELQNDIIEIEKRLKKDEITKEEAQKLKEAAAIKRAQNIEDRMAIADSRISLLERNKNYSAIAEYDGDNSKNGIKVGNVFEFTTSGHKSYDSVAVAKRLNRRTHSYLVFAVGANNLVTDGQVAHSDFKYAGSRFYEWGLAFNSKLSKTSNLLHLQYGLSVMYNDLRPTDNRIFVDNGKQTSLDVNPLEMKDSRFRNVNLVVPVHLEFDFAKNRHEGFRIGLGGYAGVNVKSKQILKYDLDGYKTKQKTKSDFNTNDFVYGVSTYIGYKTTSLYLKYDLNTLFKDNAIDQNNISLGVRFDL